jgi:hypothetical protein
MYFLCSTSIFFQQHLNVKNRIRIHIAFLSPNYCLEIPRRFMGYWAYVRNIVGY